MRTITRNIVGVIIRSFDGKVLLGKRDPSSNGVYGDCWQLPGGGVEPDEDLIRAGTREVLEETGLDLSLLEFKLIDDVGTGESEKVLPTGERVLCEMKFYIFLVEVPEVSNVTATVLGDEFACLKWFNADEIRNIKLVPDGYRIFRKLGFIYSPEL